MPSMFSRRHYEAIAEVLRGSREFCGRAEDALTLEKICERFSELFEADNERFDRRRFEEECER